MYRASFNFKTGTQKINYLIKYLDKKAAQEKKESRKNFHHFIAAIFS
jgi:hypothetical protein